MIVVHPVVETYPENGFAFWPVAGLAPYGHLRLSGALDPREVGTAVMSIVSWNDVEPPEDHPPRPPEPLDGFLHGLLTLDNVVAAGGLSVTDTTSGTTLVPGCCCWLENWRAWFELVDGAGSLNLGHDPDPVAELSGETVRLTVDSEDDGSPVIELTAAELRPLLAGVEHDLAAFLRLAAAWAGHHLPDHAALLTAALARTLDMAPRTSSTAFPFTYT